MELNVLLRGQSNAGLLARSPDWGNVATTIEQLLGFDGVTDTVNLLEKDSDSANDNTAVGGTAFIGDWVQPVNGNWQDGWSNNVLEQGLLNFIAGLPADQKAAPTAVVWLQNETDSTNPSLTAAEWTSAVSFEAQQVRQALGQSAATVPYVFVNAIPYGDNLIDSVNQAIKLSMAQMAADPGFNATVGAQADDVNMDYGQDGTYGGPHMAVADSNAVDQRLAVAIAQDFAAYALPGSPVAAGTVDAYGPEVAGALQIGPNQVLVTAALDHAGLRSALSADAANGVGWSIFDGGTTLPASGAQVVDSSHVLLTFPSAVPADGGAWLYYAYGYGRLATGESDPGQGNAVYDTQRMPIWAPAGGLPVGTGAAGTFTTTNLATGGSAVLGGSASSIPGYQSEFVAIAPENVAITANTPDAFLVAGPGQDMLTATAGNNLLCAGQQVALMVGGPGSDIFVTDARGGAGWDAIANFHPGDLLVMWGPAPEAAQLGWSQVAGEAVLSVSGGGIGAAALGFVGLSADQAQHLAIGGGVAENGASYLTVAWT
jgi:hypothetical protein